ncbi:single-stranded DNA-binding protein 3-like isoform X2 [Montipora capricornis]|uniref:single-stranded DNA-binding protein 3-like isoform X2 n=1 Tax=Montipora capricornis TaxID=246305 RepID=UPI0035F19997
MSLEKFMPLVLEKEKEGTQTTICVHQDVTFVYIKYNTLYLVSMTKKNANVALLFVFLHTIVQSSQPQASPHQPLSHQTPPGYMPNQPPQGYSTCPCNQTPYAMSRYNPATNRLPNVRIPGQPPGGVAGVPGAQPLLPSTMDPTRQPGSYQGQPMQMSRMNHPRVPVPPSRFNKI